MSSEKSQNVPLVQENTTPMMAEQLLSRLLGRYTTIKVHNPKVFSAEMIVVFCKYPVSVCEQAIDEVVRASPNWIPSTGLVDKLCWDLTHGAAEKTSVLFAQQYDARSKMQLDDRLDWERRLNRRRADAPYKRGGPGSFANVHCCKDRGIYNRLVARAEKSTDDREYRYDATGIWVPLNWI